MRSTSRRSFARVAAGALAGVLLACTVTASPSTVSAAAVAPFLPLPMQPLNVGQENHSAFPGMTRRVDGSLILVWREGSDHVARRDGKIRIAESHDAGVTWINPQTIRVGVDYRDPSISTLDGVEYLTWFGARADIAGMGAGVMRAWNVESRRIDSLAVGAMSAPLVRLPNGQFGAAFYGRLPGETVDHAWMGWSWDSWDWTTNRVVNLGPTPSPEPYLVVNGGLTHVLYRWGDSSIGIRSSWDSGRVGTWDAPRPILDNATGRPTTIATQSGTLVMVYREASTKHARLAFSTDNGATWSKGDVVLPAPLGSPHGMTYATMVETSPGRIRVVLGMEQADGSSDLWGGTVIVP